MISTQTTTTSAVGVLFTPLARCPTTFKFQLKMDKLIPYF